jgi:DNA ligase-1
MPRKHPHPDLLTRLVIGEPLAGIVGHAGRTLVPDLEDMSEKYPDIGGTILVSRRRLLGVALTLSRADIGTAELLEGLESARDGIDRDHLAVDDKVPQRCLGPLTRMYTDRSKKDVELGDIKVRVGIFCFDLMFLNELFQ